VCGSRACDLATFDILSRLSVSSFLRQFCQSERMKNVVHVTIPVSVVFPEVTVGEASFRRALGQLSRTDTVFHICRLNSIISAEQYNWHEAQRESLKLMSLGRLVLTRINDYARTNAQTGLRVVSRGHLLELLRWVLLLCKDLPGDGTTFQSQERREALLQALLLAGHVHSQRVHLYVSQVKRGEREANLSGTAAWMYGALQADAKPLPAAVRLVRARSMYRDGICEAWPQFRVIFQEFTGIELDDYLAVMLAVTANDAALSADIGSGPPAPRGSGIFPSVGAGRDSRLATAFDRVVDRLSLSPDQLCGQFWPNGEPDQGWFDEPPQYPHRQLYSHPIVSTEDGRACVIDPAYACNAGLLGIVFACDRLVARGLRLMGSAFESYIHELFRHISPRSDWHLCQYFAEGEVLRSGWKLNPPDGMLVERDRVVLIEAKHALLPEAVSQDVDGKAFETSVLERFGGQGKGVGQLAKILNQLKESSPLPELVSEARLFVPMMVVRDDYAGGLIYQTLVSAFEQFWEQPDGARLPFQKPRNDKDWVVAPLLIITLRDLERLETVVPACGTAVDVLCDYATNGAASGVSLSQFLQSDSKYTKSFRGLSLRMIDEGIRLLDEHRATLWGPPSPE